jgi:diguanylate cyclase (GGDEF)-like protein
MPNVKAPPHPMGRDETGPDHEGETSEVPPASGVDALSIAHAINDPLAALIANLGLVAEALDEPEADLTSMVTGAKEPLREAQQSAERIRAVVRHLQVMATPPEARSLSAAGNDFGPTEPETGQRGRHARVLVVDDEEMIGSVLQRNLREHEVHVLGDAREALERIRNGERFDVIFCDLMMPEMTGMELYEEIVRAAPHQAASMVFLTAGAVTTRAREFVATISNPVVAKPFDVQSLRDMIGQRVLAREHRERVTLVVDDDEAARAFVVRWLRGAKFRCIEHTSGTRAAGALVVDPAQADVVVLDVMMPGMDGFEVVAGLKANPATTHLPIILLTAQAIGEQDIARGIEAGAVDYLTKPFSGPVLVAKVRAACERAEAERAVRARLNFAEEHATTHALTGLKNRRAFDARLVEAMANATRHHEALALVMLDLDHFKRINDTFGHAGGDRTLLYFARALRRAVRAGDQAFRYGGEEFALLLHKCDAEGALRVVTRIQRDLRERPVSLVDGKTEVVRFSAGIATVEARNNFRVEEIVARADAALYKAKNGGRDRIEVDV